MEATTNLATGKKFTTSQITILGLMTAILLLMAYTPLGYLNIGPLAITFNVIPVAVSAIVLGPVGGAFAGAVFGLTSFLQCIGIGGTSAMGAMLFSINPFFAFVQRFVPRLVDGLLLGYIFRGVKKITPYKMKSSILSGVLFAILNAILFTIIMFAFFSNNNYFMTVIEEKWILLTVFLFIAIEGFILGFLLLWMRRKGSDIRLACGITGFCSAFLNTLLFMSTLILLFGNTEYMKNLIGGKNVIAFVCTFVGVNAVCEIFSSTILTGAIGAALYKAHVIPGQTK